MTLIYWVTIGIVSVALECKQVQYHFNYHYNCIIKLVLNQLLFSYHHTISPTLLYGFRESLAIFCEEGIQRSIERHRNCSQRLQQGIAALGLEMYVKRPEDRLPTVNAIIVPAGIDWKLVSDFAMRK